MTNSQPSASGAPAPSITQLPKASLRERVSSALRAAIISGEMAPGALYSAPSLAARFGVSATPVREAMLDLVKEGHVTIAPNKGFRVTEVDDTQLDEIAAVRRLLEPPVLRQVTPVVPAADFPDLRRLAQRIVDEAEAGDLAAYTEADRTFHLRLLAYAGNARLVEIVSDLRGQTRLLGLASLLGNGGLVESAREHLTIVDLLESRDADAVEAFMQRHIDQVRGRWARPPA
jgi:DNA-binding GntR family transcriptional regulator